MATVRSGTSKSLPDPQTGTTSKVAPGTSSVTEALRDQILDGTLLPGTRLGQEFLAERFGASRMPIRQALQELEAQGLVSIVPRSGAWVASLDATEFDRTYRLRLVVEPFALEESVPALHESDIEELERLCSELSDLATVPLNVERFLMLDRLFHLQTYRGVHHGQLSDIVERMWNTTQHFRRVLLGRLDQEALRATQRDHELILDAVKRRDAASAAKLMWVHINRTHQTLEFMQDIFD